MNSWQLEEVQSAIRYEFKDASLLEEALTHYSYNNGKKKGAKDYERLEFLGDRVVNLFAAHHSYHWKPSAQVGSLDQELQQRVSNSALAEVAKRLGLEAHVRVGKSPQAIDYVLACCFEAVIGAVFLDSDYHYEVVNQVLATIFGIPAIEKRLRNNGADPTGHNVVEKGLPKSNKPPEPIVALEPEDAKGRLRQLVRKILGQDDVDFSVFRRDQGRVIVEAKVGEVSLGKGQGKNIAAASENAAEIILKRTQGLTVNLPQALRKEEPSM